jgi:hypothetical protein
MRWNGTRLAADAFGQRSPASRAKDCGRQFAVSSLETNASLFSPDFETWAGACTSSVNMLGHPDDAITCFISRPSRFQCRRPTEAIQVS